LLTKTRMKVVKFLFLVFFVEVAHESVGQGEMLEDADFDSIIQGILPQQENDVDYNDLYDRLFSLYISPLDLNEADRKDFQSLYFLNESQISGILQYRASYGQFKTIYELMAIESFDRPAIERLRRFVEINSEEELSLMRSLREPGIHELFLRHQFIPEQKKGYSAQDTSSNGRISTRYAGGPARLYGRYLIARPGRYSFGVTVEKDPGEKLIWDPETKRYGMDYYSFHGMVEHVWKFRRIAVGDFSMDFGQGLIFGSGIRVGKGTAPVTTIRRNEMGLRPYRSVYEGKDYRGIAVSMQLDLLNLNLFVSDVKRDARINEVENAVSEPFTSYINDVGLHRTPYEIASKHTVTNRAYGGNLNVKLLNSKLEIGLNGVYNDYSTELLPVLAKHRLFQFAGRSNYNGGGYVNYYLKRGHLFSELAYSKSGGVAHSSGLIMSLSSQVQTAIHYRDYSKKYHTFSSNAFGENTTNSNERGIYWGISIKPTDRWLFTGYFDYFSFPWLKYRVDAPSEGRDFMGALNYYLSQNTSVSIEYRNKTKSENSISDHEPVVDIIAKATSRLRFNIDHQINDAFSLKTWIQSTRVKLNFVKNQGFMMAQDISYVSRRMSVSGRFAIFDSDDYNSRLYMYERDLLYVYNIPSFSNRGIRYYLVCKYELSRLLTMWIKLAQTRYYDIDTIGSGLEEIQGSTKTNISWQLRFRF
jgi:hypothetical protein